MKTVDYINTLIKEKEELKALCKSHVETIRLMKREMNKLNNTITKKDKRIKKLENESPNIKLQKELDKVKNDLNILKIEYDSLQSKYNSVMCENEELKSVFDDIENNIDGDE
jgi:predicted  nucleic acid-binding Zn-ribbon protein